MEVEDRSRLLLETSLRHGSFEAVAPPHDWWDWYAAYMDAREGGTTADEAAAPAGRHTAEATHVAGSAQWAVWMRFQGTAEVRKRGRDPGRISASTAVAGATAA